MLEQEFTVCQVADYSQVNWTAEFCFTGKTDEEYSLVCATGDVPANVIRRDDGWKGFRIQGILDFSLVGILSKIATLLAENSIPIFASNLCHLHLQHRLCSNESGALRKGAGCSQTGGIYNRKVVIPL